MMAQDGPPQAAPAENSLTQFVNMDAKDTATKLTLLQQEVYQEEVQTAIVRFTLQYGSTVHIEPIEFPSTDLATIPGYVFTPAQMQPGKKYPAIVFVHGGFHTRFTSYFFKIIATAVQKGYVAIFPDYRGSLGYGSIHYENSYGTADVGDVFASADWIASQPYVDPARLGIVGHSRGGMVTLLAIEQAPKKFKVATEIAGLVDFLAYMAYKPEFRRQEVAREPQFGGMTPDKNLAAYIKISPIDHVQDIQTPLLVMGNTFDQTVPFELHGGRLVDLLKADGKVYEEKLYKDAPGGHMFPFADTEQGRDVFARVFEWNAKYLNP
jgi:dipeptidyl aminopeptidase/acylaminoacyl peptidase